MPVEHALLKAKSMHFDDGQKQLKATYQCIQPTQGLLAGNHGMLVYSGNFIYSFQVLSM